MSDESHVVQVLYQRLNVIFRKHCICSSRQIRAFLRDPKNSEKNFIINLILEQKAVISRHFSNEQLGKISLLWIAVLAGYWDLAELLLLHFGADVDELLKSLDQMIDARWSRLLVLIWMGAPSEKQRRIRLVAEHGVDLQARDAWGQTALHLAVKDGRVRMAEMLLEKGADLQARGFGGQTALHIAVEGDRVQIAEMLLEKGADLQARDSRRQTVIQLAATRGLVQMAEMLLEKGADLQARDFRGQTALHHAVEGDQVQMAEMLLKNGADLETQDIGGKTALHFATSLGRIQIIEMLLGKGAEVNVAGSNGVTPLFEVASSSKAAELVPLLMRHGADVFARDDIGHNVFYPLSRAPLEHVDLARLFIEKGISPDVTDRDLLQPIHLAIRAGHSELVKLYLDHGIDVNSLARKDCPLLHLAARARKPAVLETLLKRGANIDQKRASNGRTAFHEACNLDILGRQDSQLEIIRLLLYAGADVLVEDDAGETPFALLMNSEDIKNSGIRLILRTLALKRVCQPTIELKDERLIEGNPKTLDYYRDCFEQIERTKSRRFIERCTYFDLLTKCHCQIAALMRNPEFESKFKLYDLSEFSMYAEDIARAFERAQNHHRSMLEQEDVISDAVYGILPHLVVRRVAHYILNCCENMK